MSKRDIRPDGKTVLWAGGGLIVANKPAGVPSTGRTLADPDCLQTQLTESLQRRKLWAIHQLDRGTSGINLFCQRKPLVSEWSGRLRDGEKLYLALCHGRLDGEPRDVEAPIGRVARPDGRTVSAITDEGKPARSTVTPLDATDDFSLVQVRIHTGRTHQVRLHLAHLGHPLVGEKLHREPPCERLTYAALHAVQLTLRDRHERRQRFRAAVPPDLAAAITELGLTLPEPFRGASTAQAL